MNLRTRCTIPALLSFGFSSVFAAVAPEEAKLLGGPTLTEWGAERGANKDGSIPAWTGERIRVPTTYDPKDPGQVPDPFDDKPLYFITAQNMDKYADKLNDGLRALFKSYPNFRMEVYPGRRTVSYPPYVIENTLRNATACKATNSGLTLEGCWAGVPFPIPKTGNEVIWNSMTKFSQPALEGNIPSYLVDANGQHRLQGTMQVNYQFPYWYPDQKRPAASNSDFWVLRFDYVAPARRVGEKYIIINTLDAKQRSWLYLPGQRRVKLAPDLAYDTPSPVSGGVSTMDETGVFQGAQDRYDFKLIGKRENYLIVNANKLSDYKACPVEKLYTKNFANPECVRWELRRTWAVDAVLKPGYRHIIPKRSMYFDEDSFGANVGQAYDAAGRLFRFDFTHQHVAYNADGSHWLNGANGVTYDLLTGIYSWNSAFNVPGGGYRSKKTPLPPNYFSPEALAGEGLR